MDWKTECEINQRNIDTFNKIENSLQDYVEFHGIEFINHVGDFHIPVIRSYYSPYRNGDEEYDYEISPPQDPLPFLTEVVTDISQSQVLKDIFAGYNR